MAVADAAKLRMALMLADPRRKVESAVQRDPAAHMGAACGDRERLGLVAMRRLLLRSAVLALSLAFALALGEFVARWLVEGSFQEALGTVTGSREADDPRADGLVFDDELGFRLGPGVLGLEAHGVRHAPLKQPKPPELFRALLLGDSIGFPLDGFFADVERHCRATARRDVEFVNACVYGYTTWQERRFFERDLASLSTDLVVLQWCVNDNYAFLHRLTSGGRALFTAEAHERLFPPESGFLSSLSNKSALVYCMRKLAYGMATESQRIWEHVGKSAWSDDSWGDAERNFVALRDAVVRAGGAFVIVAVPHQDQIDEASRALDPAFVEKPQREIARICALHAIPFLDLLPILRPRFAEGLYSDRLHLTAQGHRIVGAAVADFLVRGGHMPTGSR